jgi:gluconolactonase
MKTVSAAVSSIFLLAVLAAQGQPPRLPAADPNAPPPSVQAPADPGYTAFVSTCKTPPPARGGRPGGAPRGGGGGAPGAGAGARGAAPAGLREYTVTAIPGVIAAGQQWRFLWQQEGNNGDGVLGTDDGALLIAQNDSSRVLRMDPGGKTSTAYTDTRTGGALSMNTKGALFIVSRGLKTAVQQLAPERRVVADTYQGEPLDCIGGVINDLTADGRGGVYFTMGGVYYANPKGVVTKYGENVSPNGIVLSGDERILYVTNQAVLTAFDVQPDGSLTNQRELARLEAGGTGDGLSIDSAGRIYVTSQPGVQVIGADGKYLGVIPTPRNVISGAFGGPDKRTFFILARGAVAADGSEVANAAQVYSIPMLAQGYRGRAK